jgi:5,10-methylenetetrahydromethanopterin reductase
MDFGVCWAAKPDDLDYVELAERLGYKDLWVTDSQMLWGDCYAAMALAATRTSTMRIGTGVAVAGTRPAAVHAAGHATINAIAPGRVFCGIGTGNTAMRLMGHKPLRAAEFDQYLGELRGLLAGEEVQTSFRGAATTIRHLMPDHGFVAFTPRIPLYVSAFGPKATATAARHGDGLVVSVPPTPEATRAVAARYREAAEAAGRDPKSALTLLCTLTTMAVLNEGEPIDSARVKEEVGAFAIAGLHYAYEQWRQYGKRPNPLFADFWADYVAQIESEPEERRHLRIHRGHNCWVEPDEERFVTRELIEATCLVGTPSVLADRIRCSHRSLRRRRC